MKRYFGTFAFLFLSACSTAPTVTSIDDLPGSHDRKTGVLLTVSLDTGDNAVAENGCTIYLSRRGELKDYGINIRAGKSNVVVDLPAGIYDFKYLYCGSAAWELHWDRAPFQVFANQISIVDVLTAKLMSSYHAQLMNNDRKVGRTLVEEFFKKLPVENSQEVVSGYTHQKIDLDHLEKAVMSYQWDFTDGAGKPLHNSEKDWPNIRECYQNERKSNPLWLGNAIFEVSYDDGKLGYLKPKENWNTFTQTFLNCAKSKITEFHPKHPGEVRYGLYL